MKNTRYIVFAAAFVMLLSLCACSHKPAQGDTIIDAPKQSFTVRMLAISMIPRDRFFWII